MFVDIYAIQTVPPSNINRDDTGSPKTALYGGVRRARVSSQAWKRAMRQMMPAFLPEGSLGVRTKLAAELIAQRISKRDGEFQGEAAALAKDVLEALGIKIESSTRVGDDEGKLASSYLIFISISELDALADVAIKWGREGKPKPAQCKKEAKAAFSGNRAVDIALFGRMLADVPQLNTDASAQVAHAISVDRVTQEYDYFTAVDDEAADDNDGASMIGTVDFNSSTLYRYATVNLESLRDQLGDDEATARGITAFAEAFIRSMPTGKQNTFANRTLPSAVVVALREAQPINVVSAFEVPVRPEGDASISQIAAAKLGERLWEVQDAFDEPAVRAWNVTVGPSVAELDAVSEAASLKEMLSALHDQVLVALSPEA